MKNCSSFCFVAAITLFTTCPLTGEEEKTPEQFVKSWASALGNNDVEALLPHYEQSDALDVRMSNGRRYQGYKNLNEIYEFDFKEVTFSKSTLKQIHVRQIETVAIVSFQHQFQFRIKKQAEEFAGHVQTVMVLHRTNKQWKIVNEHSSPIEGITRMKPVE